MSDNEYLRELFDVNPLEEHDLVDIILSEDNRIEKPSVENDHLYLDAGRTVHLIWLTTFVPARFVKAKFNIQLETPLSFEGFNRLNDGTWQEPGSWFVDKEFTVRSAKVKGNWLQCVFRSTGHQNLTRGEIIEYLRDVAKIAPEEVEINELTKPTIVGF